jgi:tRNA(Leu) C34 or U34 (ribose-2'-O)-methylase TrmL
MVREARMSRGFAAIGLDRIKDKGNLGSVLRAAHCYGVASIAVAGGRLGRYAADTMCAYRHIPCTEVDDLWGSVPYGAVPVVVEICERARSLVTFTHPESAFYIFGPEDGSVSKSIVERSPCVVKIPTAFCMNLAATVNVVLYDRLAKQKVK